MADETINKFLRCVRKAQVFYGKVNLWIRFVKRPVRKWLVAKRWVNKPTASMIVEITDGAVHAVLAWWAVHLWWTDRLAPYAAGAMFLVQVGFGFSRARANAYH